MPPVAASGDRVGGAGAPAEGPGAAGVDSAWAATEAPHCVQKRDPGGMGEPQPVQDRGVSAAPHCAQKLPAEGVPQRAQGVVVMRRREREGRPEGGGRRKGAWRRGSRFGS